MSLGVQVMLLFLTGLVLTTILSYWMINTISGRNVLSEKDAISSGLSNDIESSLHEYASYEWVIEYLITHKDEDLDLEYDEFDKTIDKQKTLLKRHEGLIFEAATAEELEAFSEEDQKLFAAVVYNYWLRRFNDLKKAFNVDYLYILAINGRVNEGFFLLSASDGTVERGVGPENAYILGREAEFEESNRETFTELFKTGQDQAIFTENYVSRYQLLFTIGDMNIISGMSLNVKHVRSDVEKQTWTFSIIFFILLLVLSLFCLLHINRYTIKPLRKVILSVDEFAQSKDSKKVAEELSTVSSRNEIADLADGVTAMANEIGAYFEQIESITAEKERTRTELALATNIQVSVLPHVFPAFPNEKRFDIYASMYPAKEVGGDLYNFFLIDEDHLCLVIGDVSGKGVPAALYMMNVNTILHNFAMLGKGAAETLEQTNDLLCATNDAEMFVTVWMGILEISTGKLAAANAGHEYPALKRSDGKFELLRDRHGLVLGGMEGVKFKGYDLQMYPGDKLFVYTDGVPEATNDKDQLFGTDRMTDALNIDPDGDPQALLQTMKQQVDLFVGDAPQFDDLTMLCLEYKGGRSADVSAEFTK